jgi:peptidoglycan/LPS O-acetylase OafA/YrhL
MAVTGESGSVTAVLSSTKAPSPTRHIPSLDGIRAVSFMLVFVAHTGLENVVPGGFGVTIFFFLSGFLITTLMRAEHEKNGSVNLPHFWLRRALRILPPFYAVLLGAAVATLLFDSSSALSLAAVSAQALHVVNYWMIANGQRGLPSGTVVYWSLAVEEHFYLVFPWLYLGMRRLRMTGRSQAFLLWTICATVLVWRFALVLALHAPEDRTYMATDTRIDSILFGCALAVWNNPILDTWTPPERLWKYVVVPFALMVLVSCLVLRNPVFRETLRYSMQGLALMPLFTAAIAFKDWPPFRLLNTRPVAFIGILSYSLYLVHYAVIFAVARCFSTLPAIGQDILSFLIALGIAWTIYFCIEKPCAVLRRRLSD